jgi:hypothetical protein
MISLSLLRSCDSSVSIVSKCRLDDRGLIPGRGKEFLLCGKTGTEAHSAPYPVGTGGGGGGGFVLPGLKRTWGMTLTTHPI